MEEQLRADGPFDATDATCRLGDALSVFAATHAVADGATRASHWYPGRGLLHVRLPNFAWRRRAITRHDAHHVLTGYPCTPAGEMQMAAWEFAAGRYPHAGATMFCLPLVALGASLLPRRTFAAFIRGRRSTSLYATGLSDEILATRVGQLRDRFAPPGPARPTFADRLAYLRLVAWSLALLLSLPLTLLSVWVALHAR